MTKNQPMNQSTMNSSETAEFSDLDWLKVQEELSKIQPPTEPFLTKAARLTKENPFVPFGALATTGCLVYGLYNLQKGDRVMQQKMMRYRVLAQGFTFAAFIGGMFYYQQYASKK